MPRWLLEFYDSENLCNVISLIRRKYSGVTYFYSSSEKDGKEDLSGARAALGEWIVRTMDIPVEFCDVTAFMYDIPSVAAAIGDRVKKRSDKYDVDLTGGPESFIAAAGYFMAAEKPGNVTLQAFDILTGKRTLCFPPRREYRSRTAGAAAGSVLTFGDCVRLHGGEIINSDVFDFSDKKLQDEVRRLWDAVLPIPSEWNRFCSLPVETLPPGKGMRYRRKASRGENDRIVCERVAARLIHMHVMYKYSFEKSDSGYLYMTYEMNMSSRTPELYAKSGTALEAYSCLAASECGIFSDCHTGVMLDMDGEVTKRSDDTRNEIDLVMMQGSVPLFVSCKNTRPTKEFLYEIETLARHFGGKFAVPALISTVPAYAPVAERAREMGIILIDGINDLSTKNFRERMKACFSGSAAAQKPMKATASVQPADNK